MSAWNELALPGVRPSRRQLLQRTACGFGGLALGAMLADAAAASGDSLVERAPHYPARAKRVIFLFMQGGPSQLDLFEEKQTLVKGHGQRIGAAVQERG